MTEIEDDRGEERLNRLNDVLFPRIMQAMTETSFVAITGRIDEAHGAYASASMAGTRQQSSSDVAQHLFNALRTRGQALSEDAFDWKRALNGAAFAFDTTEGGGGPGNYTF